MITLINPPGIKTFSGLQMHSPKAVVTGTEETRYAKWFVDRLYTRRRWRRLAESATR